MNKPQLAWTLLLLTCTVPQVWGQAKDAKDAKPAAKAESVPDPIMQQASKLEGDLGKLKDTSPDAGELMLKLVDLYHDNARMFGLIRVGQRFVSNHLNHARHAEAMLKLLDGYEAASRNKETVATCRQFLLRYPTNAGCQTTEERLARTLDMMTDRAAAGDANAAVWRRQPTTDLGRRSLTRAITQYGEAGTLPAFTKAAELAEEAVDKFPAGEFVANVGGQAVYYWERLGQYAKSNQAALKLLAKGLPQDREALRLLHMTMGENYARANQRQNSADSFAKARAIKDSAYLLNRQALEVYNSGAKAPQLEPLITEFFQKYPQDPNRFAIRSYLALVHIRDGQKDAGLAITRELLPHDARTNSMGAYLVQQIPQEPAQFTAAEAVLLDAVNRNPKDASYLRYVLAFELYRDRIKDLNKARQMCRDLITKSPSNDSYTQSAIHWLLFNPANDAEFAADLDRVVEVRKQYAFWDGLRAYLPQWIEQAKTTKGSEERSKLAQQKLKASEADGFIANWVAIETPGTPKSEAAVQKLLVLFTTLTDDQAKAFINRVAYYYLHYGTNAQRARSVGLYAQLAKRFPKDYGTAYYYLYSATGYGNEEQNKEAVAHVLNIEPQAYDSNYEIWYRIGMGAARAKDAELMKRGYAWIRRCQDAFGNDVRYADSIGDYLTQLNLKTEAAEFWRRQMMLDYNNYYSRSCAGRIFAILEGPAKLAFINEMMAAPKGDYHGVYAMWLAEHYLMLGDLPNFRKTLVDSQALQKQRAFRAWGIEEYPVSLWIAKYRAEDPKITVEDRRAVFTLIRDLDIGRPSASAQAALLELPLPEAEKRTEMERLLAYQRTTTMLWYATTDWDWLIGYAQAAMAKRDYAAVAALVGGMLENMRDAGPDRQKTGREMVAQSYARMGAVGLAIDESSPTAPLMQAALYLRLGDRRLAFDTYAANKALFDKHKDELPVDLISFVCESHIAAGGEENHERVETILRGWLVKFSEAKDLDDATKAGVQLLLAKSFFKAQRYDVARSEFETVKNRYPESPSSIEAEFGIGETYLAQKDYSKAESVFDLLAQNRDRDIVIRAQFLRGVLYSRKGDRDDARKIFRGVLDMVPNIDVANETLYHLSEVYGAEERYTDQLELLRTVGRLGRRSKRWHTPGTALSIVVYDPDLGTSRQHGRIPVKITTEPGGDEETLFLYTTPGGGKGLFRADLETKLGQATKADKVLQITGKDMIHVDYPQEFKAEFKSVPLSDTEIRIASNAKLEASSGKIIDPEKESLSERLAREEREADPTQRRLSLGRPKDQIKPGNTIYLRVQDPDRDMSHDADRLPVKLTAASGDQVRVELTETGPHTGIFEGQATTGELPAGALASDTGIDHSPLMAIDQDPATYWLSQPDGATPKWLTVDMKDLKSVNHVTFTSPNAKSQAPVRGMLQGSHDGRFFFRIGSIPPQPPVPAVATDFGKMKMRVFAGDYTSYSNWQQVVDLAKAVKPQLEKEVDTLSWNVPETDKTAKQARAVLWHGKFLQERSRAVRFYVSAYTSAIVVDGQLELPLAVGDGRSVDVWLDRGTHELTIFAATGNPVQGVTALRAIEDPNAPQVILSPFRQADFDLAQPLAKPAAPRKPVAATADNGVWDFQFSSYDLRHVKLLVQEYSGEALAISQVKVSGEEDGQIIPTKADILKLAGNNILEIAAGDLITVSYTDEFTQNSNGASQLLTTQLQATYFNAYITPIIYDLVRQQDGNVAEIRKQLIRIDPGEKFIVEVVDYDHDTSPEPDQLKIRVALNDGAPQELVAQETGPGTGIFVKEIFTSDKADGDKLVVKAGDRVYCTFLDTQNTFPGHAVARETVVFVNEPAEGKVRIIETRFIRGEENPQTPGVVSPSRTVYLPADPAVQTAKVAFEVPLTIEVYDRDAAKDSSSKVIVQLTTSDGAKVDVECVVSPQFSQSSIAPTVGAETWALEEGRFIGQVILQLGSKASPALVPLTSEMPRDLIGGPALTEEERGKGISLVTRVLNLTGKDIIGAVYKDQRRPGGAAQDLLARGRLIANGMLACTDRDYDKKVQQLHVGEKMYLRVVDADLDSSDERDVATVTIASPRGEKETVELLETLAHSGVFTGSVTLRPSEKPTAGNLKADDAAIEAFFGDTLTLEYLDKAASTENGELRLSHEIPIVIGTDGLVAAFSKTFHDEKLAVETQFHIAESYFELFKSHRKLGRKSEEREDLEHGRRVLREVMEDYPNPNYTPRIAYLLGQFAQELKQHQEAIEAYRMIVRKYPEHTLAADAQFKLAQCYEEAKEFNQALEEYVTLAATYPKSPLIANVMVRIMDHFYNNIEKGDNYEVAAQVGRKFLEKFEGHEWAPKVAFRIGQAYYKSKKFAEAGKAFDDFAKVFPDNSLAADAVFWSGESFWQGKNNAEAYKRYQMCRWKYPSTEAAKFALGRLSLPEMIAQLEADAQALDNNN